MENGDALGKCQIYQSRTPTPNSSSWLNRTKSDPLICLIHFIALSPSPSSTQPARSSNMSPPRRRHSPPELSDELVEEILLRLPPDDPSSLLRASLVCKPWQRIVSHPNFLRCLGALHRAPPVLGFLHNLQDDRIPRFVPTTASSFSLPAPDRRSCKALDCRHGRALFLKGAQDLLVWEPNTGDQRSVPAPAAFKQGFPNAAVICAADGCDHRDCHGGPFRVVFVFTDDEEWVTSVCVYSSETGAWGELTSVGLDSVVEMMPSALVGKFLYFLCDQGNILQYDLAGRGLAVIDPSDEFAACQGWIVLMPAEDGGLGVAGVVESCLYLWSWEASGDGDAGWVQRRAIDLGNLLPIAALSTWPSRAAAEVIGFAEGANIIFLSTDAGVFTIELKSGRVRKVCNDGAFCTLLPFMSFYTPATMHSLCCDY